MPWPLSRSPTQTPFGRDLVAVHETTEKRIASAEGVDDPNKIVLACASAGATVALGGIGAVLIDRLQGKADALPSPTGADVPDRIVQFANALDDPAAVEAAHRVVTWALVAEMAVFFWRPNYELEMQECAKAFEFRNLFEETVAGLGEPIAKDAPPEAQADRKYELIKGALICSVSAAIGDAIGPDDPIVGMHAPEWLKQFNEGLSVAGDRLKQLAPDGLPIWKD